MANLRDGVISSFWGSLGTRVPRRRLVHDIVLLHPRDLPSSLLKSSGPPPYPKMCDEKLLTKLWRFCQVWLSIVQILRWSKVSACKIQWLRPSFEVLWKKEIQKNFLCKAHINKRTQENCSNICPYWICTLWLGFLQSGSFFVSVLAHAKGRTRTTRSGNIVHCSVLLDEDCLGMCRSMVVKMEQIFVDFHAARGKLRFVLVVVSFVVEGLTV